MELNYATTLHGRSEEIQLLKELHQQACTAQSGVQVAFVHGLSGTGKTALCETLNVSSNNNCNEAHNTYFCSGKFDQFQLSNVPFAAIVQALDGLGKQLLETQNGSTTLQECLQEEAAILKRMVPSFSQIPLNDSLRQEEEDDDPIKKEDNNCQIHGESNETLVRTSERLAVGLRSFLRKFCQPAHCLILYMDDLQWSSQTLQHVIATLLNDAEIHNLLFLGGYRDEDASIVQPLMDSIQIPYHNVPLGNLTATDTNSLVMEILNSSNEGKIMELSQMVHKRTLGNAFFVIQFCKTIKEGGLLVYNYARVQWEWDIEKVQVETSASDNVIGAVSASICLLPPDVVKVLKIGACIGFSFDSHLLEHLYTPQVLDCLTPTIQNKDESVSSEEEANQSTLCSETSRESDLGASLAKILKHAEEAGFVELHGSTYQFSHDKVQSALVELLPQDPQDRIKLHWKIGKQLEYIFGSSQDPKHLIPAVIQLNLGWSLAGSDSDRLSLVEINLRAARFSKTQARSEMVVYLLDKAISLVKDNDWLTSYDLLLEVFSFSAEVEFSSGSWAKCMSRNQTVLEKASSFLDTVRCRIIQMELHGAKRELLEAIDEGYSIIHGLGVKIPQPSPLNNRLEYQHAKKELTEMSDSFYMSLPKMTSPKYILIMRVLEKIATYGWNAKPDLAWFSYARMVRITVEHGFSTYSPYGFAGYAAALVRRGDVEEARCYARLCTSRVPNKSALPSLSLVSLGIGSLIKPAALLLEPALKAYRVGLETGEVFNGSICIAIYTGLYLFCGLPLNTLLQDMSQFAEQLKLIHLGIPLSFLVSGHRLAYNLTGEAEKPLDFSIETLRCSKTWSDNIFNSKEDPAFLLLKFCHLLAAFVLRDLDDAEQALSEILSEYKHRRTLTNFSMNWLFTLLEGLVSFAITRRNQKNRFSTKKAKFKRLAFQCLKEMRGNVKNQMLNCDGIYAILFAECQSLHNTDVQSIRPFYDDAIAKFSRGGFTHFAAISNELAGEHMLRCKDHYWAEHYLQQAVKGYGEWGSTVKVESLKSTYNFISTAPSMSDVQPASILGKPRYNPVLDKLLRKKPSLRSINSKNT